MNLAWDECQYVLTHNKKLALRDLPKR